MFNDRFRLFSYRKFSNPAIRRCSVRKELRWGAIALLFFAMLNPVRGGAAEESFQKATGKPLLIAYMGSARQFDFWEKLHDGVFATGKRLGLTIVDYSTSNFSIERQNASIKRLIRDGVSGLILGAAGDDLNASMDLLQDAGIPVVTVDVPIRHPWVASHVATGNANATLLASEQLLAVIREKGSQRRRILILSGDRFHDNGRTRGQVAANFFGNNGFEVKVHYSPAWSGSKSLSAALDEFSAQGDNLAGAFAAYAQASVAMVEAAERYGLDIALVGFDLNDRMRQMLESNRLDASVVQDPGRMGMLGVETMAAILAGVKVDRQIDVPAVLLTSKPVGRR